MTERATKQQRMDLAFAALLNDDDAAALTALGLSASSANAATTAPTDPTYGGRGYVKSERDVSRASVGRLNVHWTADVKTRSPAAAPE